MRLWKYFWIRIMSIQTKYLTLIVRVLKVWLHIFQNIKYLLLEEVCKYNLIRIRSSVKTIEGQT